MARFDWDDPVTILRDFDPDETGTAPVPASAQASLVDYDLGGTLAPVAVSLVSGTVYSANLGRLPALGHYEIEWFAAGGSTLGVTTLEVVSDLYVTLADIRSGDPEFADKVRFPAERLRAGRDYMADEFEAITGLSFTRRVSRLSVVSDGSGYAFLPVHGSPTTIAVSVGGVAAAWEDYPCDDNGILTGPALSVSGSVVSIALEWGLNGPPEDVKRAAAIRVRSVVSQSASAIPDRATSVVSPDGGQMTLATPGRAGYETGIPEVDAILARHTFKVARDLEGML